jgi:hypothetical protein
MAGSKKYGAVILALQNLKNLRGAKTYGEVRTTV